jgi:flagellar biosynthesis protein FlhG
MTDISSPEVSKTVCRNMFAIASGKGGGGKTWLAISLCHAFAKHGKKGLLFDGDLGLANVDIQLGLTPDKDLGTVIEGKCALHEAVFHYDEGNFDILAGRSGSGHLANLSSSKIAEMRDSLVAMADNYDHIAVDLGAGVDRAVRQLAAPASKTYIVLTDEPTSLTDAYAFIKLGRMSNPSSDFRIIVNMAISHNDGQKTYETIRKACENFLGYVPPLVGIVRRDAKVRDAIRAQISLLTRSPNCEAANDISKIAERILSGA